MRQTEEISLIRVITRFAQNSYEKQSVDRHWSLGFIFSLRLLSQMSGFVNCFVITKILRLFLRLKGAIFGIIFKNMQKFFFFGHINQNG